MTTVSMREFKARLPYYLRRSEGGEHIVVTRRGKPVAEIGPPPAWNGSASLRAKLLELQARGVVANVGTGKPIGLNPPVKLRGKGPSLSEMILEDRR